MRYNPEHLEHWLKTTGVVSVSQFPTMQTWAYPYDSDATIDKMFVDMKINKADGEFDILDISVNKASIVIGGEVVSINKARTPKDAFGNFEYFYNSNRYLHDDCAYVGYSKDGVFVLDSDINHALEIDEEDSYDEVANGFIKFAFSRDQKSGDPIKLSRITETIARGNRVHQWTRYTTNAPLCGTWWQSTIGEYIEQSVAD